MVGVVAVAGPDVADGGRGVACHAGRATLGGRQGNPYSTYQER